MTTLADYEAAADRAIAARDAARDRLERARSDAQEAIQRHAQVQCQVVGGAGALSDVDEAAATRDEALAALQAVAGELDPAAAQLIATADPSTRRPGRAV
jgi:hypothetical protein